MKVLHVSTSDKGGAGIAASRLNESMVKNGIDSEILVLRKFRSVSLGMPRLEATIFSYIRYHLNNFMLRNVGNKYGLFSLALFGSSISKHPAIVRADVIYLHWVLGGFLNISALSKIFKSGKRIIIFMHDMWYFTGGCHHSFDCLKYRSQCNECQVFNKKNLFDVAKIQFQLKERIFQNKKNITIVAPSKWLAECAKTSFLFKDKNIKYIPNTLNVEQFFKADKVSARFFLNLNIKKKIVCFGADSGVLNPSKGWKYLEEALKLLREDDLEVLVFGSNYNQIIEKNIPFKVHFTGKLTDEIALNVIYNAIDVFVMPSLAENAPQVIMESMMCGVPVVGFNIGGISEMIEHKETGYLAKYKDSEDLAEGIHYILHNIDYKIISANAIKKARFLSDENRIISMHKALWEQSKTL